MTITFKNDFDVDSVMKAGSDEFICKAARVSTLGTASLETDESAGLIKFLLENRHGSPFEHGLMTFRITAPIFVWHEFMRHRIGFSYNEESGRYKVLDGVFYLPSIARPIVQVGKPGHYTFEKGTQTQAHAVYEALKTSYKQSWDSYNELLQAGIAKEVARMCLPVGTYSTAYVTCNPRSMMSFLSLRTKHEDSMFPSYPQWEINKVADLMERHFEDAYPLTHAAFQKAGRVSP